MRMRTTSLALGLMFLTVAAPAARAGAPVSSAALDTVLARHLSAGQVDYGALARDPGPLLRFLAETSEARPEAWPREERIAFWVNVYNARVLDGVIRRPGSKSVLDVGKMLGVPTLGFFREKGRSGGRRVSLNEIEHDILRKGFGEARLHFVLNCASASCPVLPERALRAATLEADLDAATRDFLHDRTKNRIGGKGPLELSAIFKWYRSDFGRGSNAVQQFVARHWTGGIAIDTNARINHMDYDWALNGHW